MIYHIKIIALLIMLSSLKLLSLQDDDFDKLSNFTLEELINQKITTGNLSSALSKNSPSAITTITKEQIEITNARNLATLLEIYVPGMVLMTHQEGDKIGIRGQIAAENYKLILLVNGKNLSNMVYEGVMTEIDQWDMSDIEKIEIIRGPGSVTYGGGALAGVINIITKNSDSQSPNYSVGMAYDPVYRSKGGNLQYSENFGDIGVYFHSSFRYSDGQELPDYYHMEDDFNSDNRFIGKKDSDTLSPQVYLGDALERPQIKSYLDLKFGKNFRVWTRYSQSGQTHYFTTQYEEHDAEGNIIKSNNSRQLTSRQIAISPEYNTQLNQNIDMKVGLTFDNQEYIRYNYLYPDKPIDHYLNIKDYAFSQERYVGNILFNYEDEDKLKITTGYEFNKTDIHAPWGKSDDYLWIQEGVNIISDSNTNVYYIDTTLDFTTSDKVVEVGHGIETFNHSHILEATYNFNEIMQMIYSHRIDIPSLSSVMYSPRICIISNIDKDNILKLTAQRSLRMMPLRSQFLYNKNRSLDTTKEDNEHEALNSIELGYICVMNENIIMQFQGYFNDINAVGYTGYDLQFLGNMQLFGIDAEARFQLANTDIIFNHSYLNLIKLEMNEELKTGALRNNISFSDYYYTTEKGIPLLLEGAGNGLNNWANNSTRLIVTHKVFEDNLILHANARMFWDYDGSYDEMKVYENAYNNFDKSSLTEEEKIEFENQKSIFWKEKELLEKQDVYNLDFRLNASVSYRWKINDNMNILATLYSDNMLGSRVRYYVSTGSNDIYPGRLKFILEPRTIGFKLKINY